MRQAGGWLVATVFRCASWAEKGVLPAAGGLMQQPAWLIDAIEVLWSLQGQQRLRELESIRNG